MKKKLHVNKFEQWLEETMARVEQENEENDYRVFWEGNDIDGADAMRVLRVVKKKYTTT